MLSDIEGRPLTDRLVDQTTELAAGPKEAHDGIIKLEVTIENSEDTTNVIEYLQQLKGLVPIKENQPRGRKSSGSTSKSKEQEDMDKRLAVIDELEKDKNSLDQEQSILFLRNECNFVLMTEEHLEEMGIDLGLKKIHKGKYQWFLRALKLAKDPKNDKFDPNLAIGMKVLGEPADKVIVYHQLEFLKKLPIPAPKKKFVMKKQDILKFPKFMTPEERLKYRKEHRELMADKSKVQSKFYNRWEKDVVTPEGLKIGDRVN